MKITKIGETQILEIINGNPEITKKGRPITKRDAILWLLTIEPVQRRSTTVGPRNLKLVKFGATT